MDEPRAIVQVAAVLIGAAVFYLFVVVTLGA